MFGKSKNEGQFARVVICDDEKQVRDVLRKALEKDGRFEIIAEAENGTEGAAAVESHRPDVLLLDFAMPGTTGVEVLRSMRERFPDTKIVVCTGHFAMRDETLAMGADAFVPKAERPKVVVAAVADVMWQAAS